MKYNIRGEKIEITDSIRKYIEEKVSRIEKFFDNSEDVEVKVVVKIKGTSQTIEVTINAAGLTIRAEESHSDLYAAIDLVADKLERQIIKNKAKLRSKRSKFDNINLGIFEEEDNPEEENKIIRKKSINLKPMDEEEAELQMELLGHTFFIFRNVSTDTVCVLYKRKDGNYGLIDTNR